MTSNLDVSFADAPSLETGTYASLERILSECELHDESDLDAECSSVWLECNGAMVDCASVDVLDARRSAFGVEILEFVCPCCTEPHESLRFG
jgi:hypothetical protein